MLLIINNSFNLLDGEAETIFHEYLEPYQHNATHVTLPISGRYLTLKWNFDGVNVYFYLAFNIDNIINEDKVKGCITSLFLECYSRWARNRRAALIYSESRKLATQMKAPVNQSATAFGLVPSVPPSMISASLKKG